jgi:hypothetical protein
MVRRRREQTFGRRPDELPTLSPQYYQLAPVVGARAIVSVVTLAGMTANRVGCGDGVVAIRVRRVDRSSADK